jgi:cyclase
LLIPRIIPVVAIHNSSVVKTKKFRRIKYIGDPINTIKIFNELEVDEVIVLDIRASKNKTEPDYKMLSELASESFMPLSYGGGINSLEKAEKILRIGFEKIILNSAAFLDHNLLLDLSRTFGSQAIVVSVDYRISNKAENRLYIKSGYKRVNSNPNDWAQKAVELGAGEIIFSCITNEGTWLGLDTKSTSNIIKNLGVPVVLHGGGKDIEDLKESILNFHASGVAIGNLAIYQGRNKGILINLPKIIF